MFKKIVEFIRGYNRRMEEDRMLSEMKRVDPAMAQELSIIKARQVGECK